LVFSESFQVVDLFPGLFYEGLELAPRATPSERVLGHSLAKALRDLGETLVVVGAFIVLHLSNED
jgi:hypothetical protein